MSTTDTIEINMSTNILQMTAEQVAAGITALGQPYGFDTFPADWMEMEVQP